MIWVETTSKAFKENNMSTNWICQKAHKMIRKRKNEQKKFMTCLEAGICPSCGKALYVAHRTGGDDKHIICGKKCPLVSPEGVDYRFITYDVWRKCINNDIRALAINT